MKILHFALFAILASCALAVPKKYSPEDSNGFLPSPSRYYESTITGNSTGSRSEKAEQKEGKDRLQRFGIGLTSGYGGGYGNTGVPGTGYQQGMTMMPLKIDLGGVFLGALVGVGAILLIPKLAHVFSQGYGYRSLDGDMSSITNILSKIDNSLEQHNIDSSSCMQRAICTYVNDAQKNMENGEGGSLDQFIFSITNNTLVSYLIDGTAVKQAIEMGKKGDIEKCTALYAKCPVSKENIMQVIASLLPA